MFLISAFAVISCTPISKREDDKNIVKSEPVSDSHSYSNHHEIRTEHIHLDLDVNFDNHIIYGVARHRMSQSNVTEAIFDMKGIEIQKITLGKEIEKETEYIIGESDSIKGAPLTVEITPGTEHINIYYQTTRETEALDWLAPELTAGKKHPYLYTQGQAILTRSWIPIQDTPMNRITYSADVKVPAELIALMSANNPKEKNPEGRYHFEMKQAIPAYLIALAVGDMKYTSFGSTCGVYSEPELADQCKYEFVDLPKMIEVAENIYGAYRWDQYDLVILPYSFPFGGMENPRLTFANPTLIAGDRSLISVVAHELAHSWSGNLVTNATWNDFWLNEGFTVYFENRIMEAMYGKEIADINAVIEYQDLLASIEQIEKSEHPEDTQLKLQLEDRSPDDGMTDIAYVKGAFFLRTLEDLVGRKKFDAFLTNYFDSHAFETITTESFIQYLNAELLIPNDVTFDTDEWIYRPGLPNNCIKINSQRLTDMEAWAEQVNAGEAVFTGDYKTIKRGDRVTQEWQAFVRKLSPEISKDVLIEIDNRLKLSADANPAIKSDWFILNVKAGNTTVRPYMEAYLIKIGRRWYIESIYQALVDSDLKGDREFALATFEKAKGGYHFVSRSTIEEVLK
jgi:leukotriene-A4 hydrolase